MNSVPPFRNDRRNFRVRTGGRASGSTMYFLASRLRLATHFARTRFALPTYSRGYRVNAVR